jgi:hypothetical protein
MPRAFVSAILAGVLGLGSAAATVLVPMSDRDLVRSSALIVTGTVRGIESVALRDGRVLTEITLGVEQVVKGRSRRSKVVISEPGGRIGTTEVHVFGTPEFTLGEHVLVFLRRAPGRRLRTTAMALGKYRIDAAGVARRTVPTLDERRLDAFLAGLGALAAGEPVEDVESGRTTADVTARAITDRFTLLGGAYRWFDATVSLKVANADTALGTTASQTVVDDALAAWTNVASASIVLQNGGSASATPSVAGQVCDGRNTIQFNDPFAEVQDLSGCSGVLAVGGFCSTGGTMTVNGTVFSRIAESDVTINNGVGACFPQTARVAEVMTHEIGHAIGLGHSSENPGEPNQTLRDATMYYAAHFDGRGASLRADDIAGVSFIYPGASGGPDADGDGVTDAADDCAATPAGLAVDDHGCACSEPGHASCDDGSVCTADSCNAASGRCVNDPSGCDDGDPCTIDTCAGTCSSAPAGDTDGDGLCDPIDGCPRLAGGDGTDANGNGVGDACECGAARPGRCIPGSGGPTRRCHLEWLPEAAAPLAKGFPATRLRCTDGDPSCDLDPLPDRCALRIMLCINNQDPRFPGCVPGALSDLVVTSPNPSRAREADDAANAALLAGAVDLGTQSLNQCSAPLLLRVPTRETRPGLRSGEAQARVRSGERGPLSLAVSAIGPTSRPPRAAARTRVPAARRSRRPSGGVATRDRPGRVGRPVDAHAPTRAVP